METVESLYFGDLRYKMENSHRLHREFGTRLKADHEIQEHLNQLLHLQEEVTETMRCMGLLELCAECGGRTAGGCCSAMMANETDSMLLLINLSAGFEVSPKRDDDYECCFLGSEGCSLKFKPFLCLNYLCRRIQTESSPLQLARLQGATAGFLGQILVLEELIRRQLSADAGQVQRIPQPRAGMRRADERPSVRGSR